MTFAALFVDLRGHYPQLTDHWYDVARDARTYAGPYPVVAHPPCERWGRYWSGGPSAKVRRIKGDDDGCFASALASVRRWGGVIEHPEASHAFAAFGLTRPPKSGGWVSAIDGWTCCVEQGHYGHRARKATWLYCASIAKPIDLVWGPSIGERLDEGFHSKTERDAARTAGVRPRKRLSTVENLSTPIVFARLLIDLATPRRS